MKKFLKKYTPHRSKVNLGWLDQHLHDPCLWNWNRKSISKAFAVGLFCACLPIPFQMVAAATLAVVFSANILLSIALVWVTNPLTMGPFFYFNYRLGTNILQTDYDRNFPAFSFSFDYLSQVLVNYGLPLLTGSIVMGVVSGIIGYTAIQWLYRHRVGKRIKRWKSQRFDA